MKIKLGIALLMLCLMSCATPGIVLNKSHLFIKDQKLPLVTVMRQSQFYGSGPATPLALDGEVIARLDSGNYVEFYVSRGKHFLALDYEWDVIRFNAKDKGKYYFHYSFDFSKGMKGKHITILRKLTPEDAAKELSTGKYELLTTGQ